jgi:hypothetical protein
MATSEIADASAQAARTFEWQSVLERLAPLRSIEPADPQLREHVEKLLALVSADQTVAQPAARDRLLCAVAASTVSIDQCSEMAERLASGSLDIWTPAKPTKPYLRSIHGFESRAIRVAFPERWPRPLLAAPWQGPRIS